MREEHITWNDLLALALELFGEAEDWVTATYYAAGTPIVNNWGSPADYGYFVCKAAHTSGASTEPGVGGSYSTVWRFVCGGGGIGPAGAAGATGSAGPAQVQQGRLTLSSGVPVSRADVTAAGTLYFTPYKGHYIGLYYSAAWHACEFAEESIALSGRTGNTNYDVFAYWDAVGEDVDIELCVWKEVQASNSPTSGSNKTINLADTDGVNEGDSVTVRDGSHNELAVVTTVNTNTSIVVASLVDGYTTPYIGFPTKRATDLAWQDGVRVKAGDTSRRYLGTIRTDASGTGEDSEDFRGVWNNDNRVHRKIVSVDTGSSLWTCNSTTWEPMEGSTAYRIFVVVGDEDNYVRAEAAAQVHTEAVTGFIGIALDDTDSCACDLIVGSYDAAFCYAVFEDALAPGMHFLQVVQRTGTADTKSYKTASPTANGMSGYVVG